MIELAAIEDNRLLIDGLHAWAGSLPDIQAEIAFRVVLVGAFGGNGTVTLDHVVPSQWARWPRGMELLLPMA